MRHPDTPRVVGVALAALALVAGLAIPAVAAPGAARTVVRTDNGLVRGVAHDDGVIEYSGIPYAAPPVGDLRWRPPQPAAPWRGIREADTPGPDCAQTETGSRPGRPASFAEDCLYLNVWRPAQARGRLPVMVWIHGGSYAYRAGRDFRPRDMAVRGDTVVVTINYRLGALGLLAHGALNSESPDGSSGAYAIMDQRAALRWVQRNAAAFGGDPGNVTIAGSSAGGASVCTHLISPPSHGLFHRAISQSGAYGQGGCETRTAEAAAADGQALAEMVGCADAAHAAACLRSVPVPDLLHAQASFGWSPALGGHTLPLDPVTAFRTGAFAHVPVLTGTNRNESTIFVYGATEAIGQPPPTAEDYEAEIRSFFGEDADAVLTRYPVEDYPHPASALAAVQTDQGFACGQRRWNRALAPQVPTYVYEFADPNVPIELDIEPSFPLGAFHSAELFYLWGVFNPASERTPAQDRLAARMIDYWATFAHQGKPDDGHFPQYDADERVLRLHPDGDTVDTSFGATHHCDFWDSLTDT